MRRQKPIAGIAVILVIAATMFLRFEGEKENGLRLYADFNAVDGLEINAPVTISGVEFGRVSDISLRPGKLDILVTMRLEENVAIPEDSIAQIVGYGLFSSKSINVLPGGMPNNLKNDDEFLYTMAGVNSEKFLNLILDLAETEKQ